MIAAVRWGRGFYRTKPSINQKCARIREAFRRIMDEPIARHYYIDGPNGEPKKIGLPERLVDIRY